MAKSKTHNLMSNLARVLTGILPRRAPSYIDRRNALKHCIFCGGSPVNKEHIWPVWSHTYLPKLMSKHFRIHAIEREDRTDIRFVKKPGDPKDRQVLAVDERCNNGWMRERVEDPIKDTLIELFLGQDEVRITPEQQKKIAVWIALRAMVSEYDDYASRLSHHKQRKMLKERQEISKKNWRVWIGRYDGMKGGSLWIEHPFLLLPDRVVARKKNRIATYTNSQTLTYVIGKLLIHVMRSPDDVALRLWRFPGSAGGKMRRIWPPTGYSFLWPLQALTDDEALTIAGSFKMYLRSIAAKPRLASAGLYTGQGKPL